jgi:N-methylhydantoinase B/oxoprolinase/acetone carboxylase alpha subunit
MEIALATADGRVALEHGAGGRPALAVHGLPGLLARIEPDELAPGRAWLVGDEAATPGDVALVLGAGSGLVAVSARWPGFDQVPARALDRFGEGLVVPPTPIAADGEVDTEVLDLLRANVRDPDGVEAAIRDQLAAATSAAATLDPLEVAEALARGEREMRAALRPLHGGRRDGVLAVAVTADPAGGVVVDLGASADASAEPVNLARASAVGAAARAAVAALATATPQNAGAWSLVEVRTRPGSILDPPPFAPRHRAQETVDALGAAVRAAIAG